jgi:hypothetical protein
MTTGSMTRSLTLGFAKNIGTSNPLLLTGVMQRYSHFTVDDTGSMECLLFTLIIVPESRRLIFMSLGEM